MISRIAQLNMGINRLNKQPSLKCALFTAMAGNSGINLSGEGTEPISYPVTLKEDYDMNRRT